MSYEENRSRHRHGWRVTLVIVVMLGLVVASGVLGWMVG